MADQKPEPKQIPFAPSNTGASGLAHPSIVPGETTPMEFPHRVILTLPGYIRVEFLPGIQAVPESLVDHPYLKANGVKRYHAESYGEMQARVEREHLERDEQLRIQRESEAEREAREKNAFELAVAHLVAKGNSEETAREIVANIGPEEAMKPDEDEPAVVTDPAAIVPQVQSENPIADATAAAVATAAANVAKGKGRRN